MLASNLKERMRQKQLTIGPLITFDFWPGHLEIFKAEGMPGRGNRQAWKSDPGNMQSSGWNRAFTFSSMGNPPSWCEPSHAESLRRCKNWTHRFDKRRKGLHE